MNKATSNTHLKFLDGLRALAALYVLLHHAHLTVFYAGRQPDHLQGILTGWMGYGHFAVDLFIVLSGFCLMIPVIRGNGTAGGTWQFFKKRARRILPTYYAALALSLGLATTVLSHKIGTIWDISLPVTRMGVVAHVLLLQNLHRAMEINSVFWSIAVECQIYLLFPLIVLAWTRFGWQKTVGVTMVTGVALGLFLQGTRLQGLTAHYLALFVLGMLGASVSFSRVPAMEHYRDRLPWKTLSLALFILLVLVCVLFPGAVSRNSVPVDLLVGLCSAAFVIAMVREPHSLACRVLSWKPLVFVGTFSYSLYLVHMPLLQLLWQFVLVPLPFPNIEKLLLLCFVGGPLIVFVAYLFFLAFERPFISKQRIRNSDDLAAVVALSPAP